MAENMIERVAFGLLKRRHGARFAEAARADDWQEWAAVLEDARAAIEAMRGHPLFAFLLGEGPLEGTWFGESQTASAGQFWWRTHLRAALSPLNEGSGE